MLFRPKIVQFKDGTYAIRFFTLFGYQYLDLTMDFYELTHSKNHDNFENCKGDLTTVENKIKLYYRQYKPKNKDKEKVLKYDSMKALSEVKTPNRKFPYLRGKKNTFDK